MNALNRVTAAVLMIAAGSTGPVAAGDMAIPDLIQKVEPCIYRVEVKGVGLRVVGVDEDGIKTKLEEFEGTGTGFTIAVEESPLVSSPWGPEQGGVRTLGFVVTNSHVVTGKGLIISEDSPPSIRLRNEKFDFSFTGELVGHDPLSDLAVIRVTTRNTTKLGRAGMGPVLDDPRRPDNLPGFESYRRARYAKSEADVRLKVLRFADPSEMRVGQDVVAVGFGHSLEGLPTVTKGILSGVDRTIDFGAFSGLLQTDASINPGNSGGPLLNARGEVLGVNTYRHSSLIHFQFDIDEFQAFLAKPGGEQREMRIDNTAVIKKGSALVIAAPLEVSQGVNYARSSETARGIVDRLIRSGKIRRPDFGIIPLGKVVSRDDVSELRLHFGVIIDGVLPGSPADRAGLRPGDIITQVGPITVRSEGDLNNALALLPSADEYKVNYLRPAAVTVEALKAGKRSLDSIDEVVKAGQERKFLETTIRVGK